MKIIVLSAGKGERLYPLTKNTPKPLLDMGNGKTLLEEQIERIQKSGVIDNIVLVIGYLAEQIESKIKYYEDKGIKITTVYNPFYDISNNLISLWFAKGEMNDSFLVTNGDNLFAIDVFVNFIRENTNGIYLSITRKNQYDNDDMKVKLNNEFVDFISKNIEPESALAESPGLLLVEGQRSVDLVKDELDKLARKPEHRNSYWLELPNSLIKKGIPIRAWEFDGMAKWQEVDIHLDITKAKKLLGISHSI